MASTQRERAPRKGQFSCNFCRLRKLRCDRPLPCTSCRSRGKTCEFNPTVTAAKVRLQVCRANSFGSIQDELKQNCRLLMLLMHEW
jgi:hypothetical protein